MTPEKRLVAVFDFDGTITNKDTFVEFIKFAKGKCSFYKGLLYCSPLLIAYLLKLYPNGKAKQRLFGYFFAGMSVTQFAELGAEFASKISTMLYPEALKAIIDYKEKGATVYVVTASIYDWVFPWCQGVGIECVATCAEIDSQGLLTGKFSTENCYGQEKVNRFTAKEPYRTGYTLYAYGDSRGDKELIEFADKGWYDQFKK